MIRHQPPVYSPLTMKALLGGATATVFSRALHATPNPLEGRFDAKAVVLCDSGTSALTLALQATITGERRPRIALPAFGCFDLATAALAIEAEVVLYDLDPETLAPDLVSYHRALEYGLDAVVVAYLYGIPFDTPQWERLATQAGATLIEDAAQAFGASIDGHPCGTLGPAGILSFGRGKGITGGGGGALLLNTDHMRVPSIPAEHGGWGGWAKAVVQFALARPSWYWLPASIPFLRLGETVFHSPQPVSRMPRVQQNVLGRVLPLVEMEVNRRQRHGERLADLVTESGVGRPIHVSRGTAGYLRYPVLAAGTHLRSAAARRLGVAPGYPMGLEELPALAPHVLNKADEWPGAKRLIAELVTLPSHSLLRDCDFHRLRKLLSMETAAA